MWIGANFRVFGQAGGVKRADEPAVAHPGHSQSAPVGAGDEHLPGVGGTLGLEQDDQCTVADKDVGRGVEDPPAEGARVRVAETVQAAVSSSQKTQMACQRYLPRLPTSRTTTERAASTWACVIGGRSTAGVPAEGRGKGGRLWAAPITRSARALGRAFLPAAIAKYFRTSSVPALGLCSPLAGLPSSHAVAPV